MDKKAFRTINYGLYIVSSKDDQGKYAGCVANTFQQIASEPPLVSVALNKENHTTKCIMESKKFSVSVLAESATMELVGKFGFHSSKDVDKFEEASHQLSDEGVPVVTENTSAIFHMDVVDSVDAGTHILFIGEVTDAEVVSDERSMTYDYYHSVLRGKTPPKASSFNGGENDEPGTSNASSTAEPASESTTESSEADSGASSGRVGWRCTLCGYIVEMDELPDDFTCPICGVGKEFFERIDLD